MKNDHKKISTSVFIPGGVIVLAVIIIGTVILSHRASTDTEKAVNKVSLLYLDELAGRREQVIENNLKSNIDDIQVAVGLMTDEDTSDIEHLQAYQARMKALYKLEKFAFVDENGIIYTALGIQENIEDYAFDHKDIKEPEISIFNLESLDKKVIIAIPVDIPFMGENLKVCFMEIDMDEMLAGVSMESKEGDVTFCNIYTRDGVALSNTILGGLAVEDNLLLAMRNARFEAGYSYERFLEEFGSGTSGAVSFTYGDIRETLSFEPVEGTDWLLTYLVRESVISSEIGSITNGIIKRGIIQTVVTVICLAGLFTFVILQIRKNSKIILEKETAETENRIKQQEMQEKIKLQEKLLSEERKRAQQDNLITAMASDYRSVYYANLDFFCQYMV